MRFADQVALITGGASGIGRATARQLAREGARVVVADINDDGGTETVALIAGEGGTACYHHTDVGRAAQVEALVARALDEYGRLDVLHNNAYWNRYGSAVDLDEEGWDRTLDITLKALYLGCKYAIPAMRRTGGGAIVNTASVHSLVSFPGCLAYDAAKAGVLGLTRSVALDFGPDIRCNAVLPGAIYPTGAWVGDTEQARRDFTRVAPLKRLGNPDDIARAVAFLASSEASFITGTGLVVDGGLTLRGANPHPGDSG
jgi:NAD(P)-dependent dehydrogenase (short-subunit alcohol dehydrogenase family)